MNAIHEMTILGQFFWFFLALGLIFLLLTPLLIWKNTANTTRLLVDLLGEQERTNELLEALLDGQRAAPGPDSTPSPADETDSEFTLEEA